MATSGTLHFAADQVTATIAVPIIDNTLLQNDRTFSVDLFSPVDFAAQQTFASGQSYSVAAADVNGDSKPDLLVANFFDNSVSVLLNTTADGATTPSFGTKQPQNFGSMSFPMQVAAADVDDDGKDDLLVAASNVGLWVLRNTTAAGDTSPSFAPQLVIYGAVAVAAADVNGDGRPDLLVLDTTRVSVLINTTDAGATEPSFVPAWSHFNGEYSFLSSVTAADMNGDGRPDMLVTNRNYSDVLVLLNTTETGVTTPSFAGQFFPIGSSYSAAAADVNGDGKPDLLVANHINNSVSVLLNTMATGATAASFTPQQTFATGTYPRSLAAADVNGDGRPDLLVTNYGSATVSVLLNTTAAGASAANFAARQTFATVNPDRPTVAAADVNGDGRPDLLVSNRSSSATVSVLLNHTPPIISATGTIQDDDLLVTSTTNNRAINAPTVLITGTNFDPVAANNTVSFNLGAAGTVTAATATQLTVTLSTQSTATGALNATVTTNGGVSNNAQVATIVATPTVTANAANLDTEPPVLLITGTGFAPTPGENTVVLNLGAAGTVFAATATQLTVGFTTAPNGGGALTAVVTSFGGSSGAAVQVATVLDLATTPLAATGPDKGATAPQSGLVRVFNALTGQTIATFTPYAGFKGGVRVAVGDVTGDGVLDVITAPGKGLAGGSLIKIYSGALLLDGDASDAVVGPGIRPFGTSTSEVFLAVGKLNADAHADIMVGNSAKGPQLRVFDGAAAMAGTATQINPLNVRPFGKKYVGGVRVAVGDVDGDGTLDVITAKSVKGSQVIVYSGQTTTQLMRFNAFSPTPSKGVFVAAGDVDGDGRTNLIVGSSNAATIKVYQSPAVLPTLGVAPALRNTLLDLFPTGGVRLAVADLNGDGRADILAAASPSKVRHVARFDGFTAAELDAVFLEAGGYDDGFFIAAGNP